MDSTKLFAAGQGSSTTASPVPSDLPIKDIHVSDRHRKDLGDIAELAASIEAIGLLHPVVVDPNGKLIAGERRIAAFKHLGLDTIPVTVVRNLFEAAHLLQAEADENTCRKDFTPSESVVIGEEFVEAYRPKSPAAVLCKRTQSPKPVGNVGWLHLLDRRGPVYQFTRWGAEVERLARIAREAAP